jgi:2-hydroxychromene-2-carboxylate isomerase
LRGEGLIPTHGACPRAARAGDALTSGEITMPALRITLYTDYKSPYAYVAKAGADRLEDEFDVELDWLPYTLDIPSYLGSVENRDPHQWRRVRYSYMDARRFANLQGLTLRGTKKIFDTRLAGIGLLYARQNGVVRAYNDAVFDRFWKRELEIEEFETMRALLEEVGADTAGFRAYVEGEGGALHDRLRVEAHEAGVFGVPMFVIEGELFWGGDRLPLIRDRLRERGLAKDPATASLREVV